ncbi:MAG TPA: YafY family transcriptional regulator [Candidatus Fimimonas merdipullorum]|uniref:YafY family transcriptional regulator n=1 Tax=Candidatus Fimimonas merdipullorum TaxID=2840822 RepID=A0A9D1MY35_9BACT|nr:YafY family transcriptional regulator [Candidatus Fimimonas merdipullorum]
MQIPVLVGIMSTLLAADETVNAQELAQKFEISKRSVYRYVAMLSEGGIPIETRMGRNGGWGIVDTYKLKATYFTEEEYQRLIFALQSFSLQDDVTKNAIQKLSGLRRSHASATVLKSDQLVVDSADYSVGDYVNVLSDCISQRLLCNIEYHSKAGAVTSRSVEPYCLILKDGSWYVYCFCRMRKAFRYFKVSRMVRLSVGERFSPREFSVDSSVIESDVLRGKEICEVILSLQHKALSACEEWLGMGHVARVGDGYVAKASLPYDEMLVSRILSLGDGVRVEKPAKLRKAVLARCAVVCAENVDDS